MLNASFEEELSHYNNRKPKDILSYARNPKNRINIDKNEIIFNAFYQNDTTIQTSYLDYFNEQMILDKQKKCEQILQSYGIDNSFVSIAYEIDENNTIIVKKIQINLKNSVINSDKDNINIIARAKNAIKNFLSVNEEQIEIYE